MEEQISLPAAALVSSVICTGFVYLLVVDKLLANLAGVDPIQAAAAFG